MDGRIVCNRIRCRRCGMIIESRTVHDYQECLCGAVAVDGGHDYLRRSMLEGPSDYEDLSVIEWNCGADSDQ